MLPTTSLRPHVLYNFNTTVGHEKLRIILTSLNGRWCIGDLGTPPAPPAGADLVLESESYMAEAEVRDVSWCACARTLGLRDGLGGTPCTSVSYTLSTVRSFTSLQQQAPELLRCDDSVEGLGGILGVPGCSGRRRGLQHRVSQASILLLIFLTGDKHMSKNLFLPKRH